MNASVTPSSTLKDVTLRSVIFNKRDITVVKLNGSTVLKDRVDQKMFDSYEHVLKVMAQLSRLVYCDLSVIRDVILNAAFATSNNKAVNDAITAADGKYLSMRRIPADKAVNGHPMKSYSEPSGPPGGQRLVKYVSSPSDVTFLAISGDQLKLKNPFFVDSDMVICFKGSSTVKNFKHDLYSQFTPAELSNVMPKGTSASSGVVGNVAGAFVSPIAKSWEILKQTILEKNPTRLFVTGHSLGGGYASLFSLIVAETRSMFPSIKTLHLVTFGSPTIVTDKARNTFNAHLDSGFMTLDRVTSFGVIPDAIPGIPAGFSHPGYQPLRTEIQPEKNTGRAYNLDTIRKVYQTGGLFGLGPEKNKYEAATKTHMPTRIAVPVKTIKGKSFAHAEYLDMTFFGGMRLYGMKNPGFAGNTFIGEAYPSGISWKYVPADPSDIAQPEADQSETGDPSAAGTPKGGKTRRKKYTNKRKTKKQWSLY